MDTDNATSLQSIEANIVKYQGLVAAEDDKMLCYKVCNTSIYDVHWTALSVLSLAVKCYRRTSEYPEKTCSVWYPGSSRMVEIQL